MIGFTLATRETLLGQFAVLMLRELHPRAATRLERRAVLATPGVAITHDGTGRWLFLAARTEPDSWAAEAIAGGACAVLTIDADRHDFERAVEALLRDGESYIPAKTARWMAAEAVNHRAESDGSPAPGAELTLREREVLSLVARGYSNAEIAHALTISSNTVRSHLHALCVKLKATGRHKMLANARALHIREAFATGEERDDRASA